MYKLYTTLAPVYHEMYQHIFDYDKEFRFYDSVLIENHCKKIIEVGCGTGLLAKRLIAAGYDYLGVDLFPEMIEIAKKETGSERFVQGDMRNLRIDEAFDCALITGRSIAYVTENAGILSAFSGISRILTAKGVLVFDAFDASRIFGDFREETEQVVETGTRKITRKNFLKKNLSTGWTWDFNAKYIFEENGKRMEYDDSSTLRAFTKDEIRLFLNLTGFEIREITGDNPMMILARKS
jgi:SAM-dependent methyltransferase